MILPDLLMFQIEPHLHHLQAVCGELTTGAAPAAAFASICATPLAGLRYAFGPLLLQDSPEPERLSLPLRSLLS